MMTGNPITGTRIRRTGLFMLALAFAMPPACSTQQKERQYRMVQKQVIICRTAPRSRDEIDAYPTYEAYFRLGGVIDSLRIVGGASSEPDPLSGKKRNFRTYLVLERVIDARRFGRAGFVYTEMGRNFDSAWKSRKDLTVEKKGADPLAILDESSTYRLRVTTFNFETAEISIEVQADAPVTFVAAP